MILHIIASSSQDSCTGLVEQNLCDEGDVIADLSGAIPAIHCVGAGAPCRQITADLMASFNPWSAARKWLVSFTQKTNIQDVLAIDGYSFWWTLNAMKFTPGWSNLANPLNWIEVLTAINQNLAIDAIQVHGADKVLDYVAGQVFGDRVVADRPGRVGPERPIRAPRKFWLLLARLVIGLVFLIFSLFRRPQICCLSSTNHLRRTTRGARHRLEDISIGATEQALRNRGWRTAVIEKYGWNATWRGMIARRLYFPNDILFLAAAPFWFRLGFYRRTREKWQEKWALQRDTITRSLVFRGVDLSPLYLELIEEQFTSLGPLLENLTKIWRRILQIWSPQLLLVNVSYGSSALPPIIAAKTLGIHTVEQQHGVIGKNHNAYLIPHELKTRTQFPLCDTMLVWGAYTQRVLVESGTYRPAQVAVCGFPRIDQLSSELPPRSRTLESLHVPVDSRVVLYTSNSVAADFMPAILDSIASIGDRPDIFWLVKLHPREKTRTKWDSEISVRGVQNVRVLEGEMDFYALLQACDIHVSFVSTTLIEAAVLGKINVGLDVPGFPDVVGYRDAGAFLPVAPADLAQTVVEILGDNIRYQSLLQGQRDFSRDWCLHDGRALERILARLESLASWSGKKAASTQT
jgi:glycosyltransferase involved in cell wall biosynthesis